MLGLLESLWMSLTNVKWINHPLSTYTAENKLLQLQTAAALGLIIPRTLVTTNPANAKDFYDACAGNVIIKALRRGAYEREDDGQQHIGIVRTTKLQAQDKDRLEDVRFCPVLLQEYIRKKYELRVTIIGSDVFTAEIYSQADERTAVDWRRYEVPIPYKVGSLPETVKTALVKLLNQLGLNYGACDLIVTEDDQYCFLEVNPCGQWLWIEDKLGLPVARAIAIYLRDAAGA